MSLGRDCCPTEAPLRTRMMSWATGWGIRAVSSRPPLVSTLPTSSTSSPEGLRCHSCRKCKTWRRWRSSPRVSSSAPRGIWESLSCGTRTKPKMRAIWNTFSRSPGLFRQLPGCWYSSMLATLPYGRLPWGPWPGLRPANHRTASLVVVTENRPRARAAPLASSRRSPRMRRMVFPQRESQRVWGAGTRRMNSRKMDPRELDPRELDLRELDPREMDPRKSVLNRTRATPMRRAELTTSGWETACASRAALLASKNTVN
mmetsp:Transcript_14065/g.52770  ORF Transcript_14065/g.52770 Transcript_14065/m.52770 type:complete len:259 (-) Transcript_14065:3094-3870(-)